MRVERHGACFKCLLRFSIYNDLKMSDPTKRGPNRRSLPLPGYDAEKLWRKHCEELNSAESVAHLTPCSVRDYLILHPELLDEFVKEKVTADTIQKWRDGKELQDNCYAFCSQQGQKSKCTYADSDISAIQRTLAESTDKDDQLFSKLYELGCVMRTALAADSYTMYILGEHGNELCVYTYSPTESRKYSPGVLLKEGTTLASHVALSKQPLLCTDISQDDRFPQGLGSDLSDTRSAMCVPIMAGGDLLGVYEYSKKWDKPGFTEADMRVVVANVSWTGLAVSQSKNFQTLCKQSQFNDFLLQVSKVMFDEVTTIKQLIGTIMSYAKVLVNADRCAMFLVSESGTEMTAELFDEGKKVNGKSVFTEKQDIRFSTSKGIAGHVARTGEVVNIADVYADPRFNREIDRQTGYTTHNMLAMPIISKGAVIGVVQMVNKRNGPRFSSADESAFKTFAVYCALALHISKAYRDMRHQQNLFNVAREMVGYYTQCSAEEVEALLADPFPRNFPEDFFKITYDCKGHENQMVKQMVYMFYDLFGTARFDLETLCRFVLSVKKSYRHAVPYHNFAHGFFVCHCLYLVLRELRWELFTENEALTLMVAALCHDVDHRGKNNSFLQKLNEPLWHIYSGSVMEKHHFQCTVGILQKQGHDLFGSMGSEEYKEALGMVRTAILDTDLLQFLPAQKKVAKWLEDGVFDVNNPEHRGEFISILMTACDLNSMCKQQECHIREVSLLYEEFYKQGDEEKLHGVEPLPMMDRSQKDKIPSQQVGFIKHICIPCYTTIVHILPFMQPMLDGLQRNLEYWQSLQNKEAMWEPEKSRPTPES